MQTHSNVISFPGASEGGAQGRRPARPAPDRAAIFRAKKHQRGKQPPARISSITENDNRNLQRTVWLLCDRFFHRGAWSRAVWAAFRETAGVPAPRRFSAGDIPAIAQEARRILAITTAVQAHFERVEKTAIRQVVRGRAPVADFEAALAVEAAAWAADTESMRCEVSRFALDQVDGLEFRRSSGTSDHSEYTEDPLPANGGVATETRSNGGGQ